MGGLLPTEIDDPRNQGLLGTALAMLAASGPSPQRRTFGQILGASGLQGMQRYDQARVLKQRDEELSRRNRLVDMQISQAEQQAAAEQQLTNLLRDPSFLTKQEKVYSASDVGPDMQVQQVPLTPREQAAKFMQTGNPMLARAGLQALMQPERTEQRFMNVGNGMVFDSKEQKFISNPDASQADRGMNEPLISLQRRRAQLKAEGRSDNDPEVQEITNRIRVMGSYPVTYQVTGDARSITQLPGRAGAGIPGAPTGLTAPPDASLRNERRAASAAAMKKNQLSALMNEAAAILPYATGSGLGSLVDTALAFFGQSTDSGDAAARLETIAGWMKTNVPRFEGPQSNRDTELYNEMAAKVGDRTRSRAERLAALDTLRTITSRASFGAAPTSQPVNDGGMATENALPNDILDAVNQELERRMNR